MYREMAAQAAAILRSKRKRYKHCDVFGANLPIARFHDNFQLRLESNERETGSVADGEVYIQLANQLVQDSLKNPVSLIFIFSFSLYNAIHTLAKGR